MLLLSGWLQFLCLTESSVTFTKLFKIMIQGLGWMKKQSISPEYFILNSNSGFAHISITGSLADSNMELVSRNMGFLKLVPAIFYQIFISDQMIALEQLWKMSFISLKSPFCSWDIQMFVFPSSPLFPPVSHCFRAWRKINLKVYDIINCLNENLITQ